MALLDLPTELLVQILEEVGGRELRRGVNIGTRRLTLNRQWYEAALPVYRSGLKVVDVDITDGSCLNLPDHLRSLGGRRLMHKNTRNLHIRLYGRWWHSFEIERVFDENYVPNPPTSPPIEFDASESSHNPGSRSLAEWQAEGLQDEALNLFFKDLNNFEVLEDIKFEVLHEVDYEQDPRWDWLKVETCHRLLASWHSLPHLNSLTLDTSGSSLLTGPSGHFCSLLAQTISRIPRVRLRMTSLCSDIFRLDAVRKRAIIRLESLVIKLNQPRYSGRQHYMTEECFQAGHYPRTMRLHEKMITAAAACAKSITQLQESQGEAAPRLKLLRISFIPVTTPQVQTVDCLSMRRVYYCGQDNFSYWPDGSPKWLEDVEGEMNEAEEYRR